MAPTPARITIPRALHAWWHERRKCQGFFSALRTSVANLWEFLRNSTPENKRQRYGDGEYDWECRVDTTSATVGWRDRLLGVLHSPYQPTEPALFHDMLASLKIDYRNFAFLDLGSGKGRVLLLASDYPFRRIVGIELLPSLHGVAQENLRNYKSDKQRCFILESVCGDARKFAFPMEPTVLYLFNPLPASGLSVVIANIEQSLRKHPREFYLLYHNPILEHELRKSSLLRKIGGTHQYSVFAVN
jgi:SAM-dependent methyltransferase